MDKSAADAYVYAKVCGIISKSYSGINAEKLFAVKSYTSSSVVPLNLDTSSKK